MRQLLAILAICATAPAAVSAQTSPSAVVYRSHYTELRAKAVGLLERVGNSRANPAALQEERFAVLKLIHRLQEEAMADNVQRGKNGQGSDKTLLLVAQACAGLDYMLIAVDSYIDTGDRAFLGLARESATLVNATEKYF